MFSSPKLICSLAFLFIASGHHQTAIAQFNFNSSFNNGPSGGLTGAGQGLRRIASRDIGRGYSVEDIIRQDINSVAPRTFAGQPRLNASTITGSPNIGRSAPKPFSGITRTPTVSPYLLLTDSPFETDSTLSDTYNTLVRPMLQQQQFNRRVSRETQTLDRELQSIAAQPAFDPRGSQTLMPTGHSAVFFNTGRYYPGNFRRR